MIFYEKVKEDLIIYLKDENFSIKLKEYFSEIEECIINKELETLQVKINLFYQLLKKILLN